MTASIHQTGEILSMFIFEAESMLRSFEGVLAGNSNKGKFNRQQLNELFRVMHTLKGSSAMMGFDEMRDSAHIVEDMLSIMRDLPDDEIPMPALSEVLYSAVSAYRKAVELLSEKGETPCGFDEINERIKSFASDFKTHEEEKSDHVAASDLAQAQPSPVPAPRQGELRFRVRLKPTQLPCVRALVILKALGRKCEYVSSVPQDPGKHPEYAQDIIKDGFVVIAHPGQGVGEDDIRAIIMGQVDVASCEKEALIVVDAQESHNQSAAKLVSVDQNRLERQIELLGELSATQAIIEKRLEGDIDEDTERLLLQSRKYITSIGETAIAMNLVTADQLFFRLRMLVREISAKLGKRVNLNLEGGDELIERNMVDMLYDPLMHMIRNSLDHGIESPKERAERGKSEIGSITVSINSRRYDVVVKVSDDGRGIDPERILEKAIEKGIAQPDRDYANEDILEMLLRPGFSTKDDITEYSGRGVGMDVVNKSVRSMSGTLSVQSAPNNGTTFTITLPASLSMVEVMCVDVGGERYIIPTSIIKRLYSMGIEPDDRVKGDGGQMWSYVVDEETSFPLIDLASALYRRRTTNVDPRGVFILVDRQPEKVVLRSDGLGDIITVVMKPLPDLIRCQPRSESLYSGCTIMPDGKIALVIDVGKLALAKSEV